MLNVGFGFLGMGMGGVDGLDCISRGRREGGGQKERRQARQSNIAPKVEVNARRGLISKSSS